MSAADRVEVTLNPGTAEHITVHWRRVTPATDDRSEYEQLERWEAYRTMPGLNQYARVPQLDAYGRAQLGTLVTEAVNVPAVLNFEVPEPPAVRVGFPRESAVYWQLSQVQQDQAYRETKISYAQRFGDGDAWTPATVELFNDLLESHARVMVASRRPQVGQRVEVTIRDARDLPPRVGRVTKVTDEDGGYVTNYLPCEPDPAEGTGFGIWVNAKAWDPEDDYQTYAVRVLPS